MCIIGETTDAVEPVEKIWPDPSEYNTRPFVLIDRFRTVSRERTGDKSIGQRQTYSRR